MMNRTYLFEKDKLRSKLIMMKDKLKHMYSYQYPIERRVMEERLACGRGACLGCTIEVRTPAGGEYRQVCADGPVFDLRQIVWR
jgi:NAD(P)H-flavin reductase